MELMSMNKLDLNKIADTVLDAMDNGTRAIIYAISKSLENLGAKGVKRCREDANRKRKASTIKT